MAEDWKSGGFGLYLHWPFCAAKCPYCDFNSHVSAEIDHISWARAFESEIGRLGRELPERLLGSIYFGGGTPSLMAPETVDRIISAAHAEWSFANDIEITLEANPGSVEAENFAGFAEAGVNRVSLGVQALNDPDLRKLGRIHSASEALQAIEIAQNAFDRVSFDLIYARQSQSPQAWRDELERAIALGTDHLSLYQLTIEPGTVFGRRHAAGRLPGLPTEDVAVELYELTREITSAAGFENYEVSNYARDGQRSRHNSLYWNYGDYAGVGPGAHGRITIDGQRLATSTPLLPKAWLNAALGGNGELPREALNGSEQATEYLLMSLRVSEGTDLERYAALSGKPISDGVINELEELGLLARKDQHIMATRKGRMVLNAVIERLLPD